MKNDRLTRRRGQKKYGFKKAALSLLLTAALVTANTGGQLGTVMAAEYEGYEEGVFELDGRNVYFAIKDAIQNGQELSKDEIEFTNGKILNYRELFYGETRKAGERLYLEGEGDDSCRILEFFADFESGMDVELRTFIRLPANTGEDYQLTGEEQIILLYLNNSSEDIRCSVKVNGRVKGSLTVKSYEAAFGNDEVELFSKDFNAESKTAEETGESASLESSGQDVGALDSRETGSLESNGTEDAGGMENGGSGAAGSTEVSGSETESAGGGAEGAGSENTDSARGDAAGAPGNADSGSEDNMNDFDLPEVENDNQSGNDGAEDSVDIDASQDKEAEHGNDSNDSDAGNENVEDAETKAQPIASLSRHIAPMVAASEGAIENTASAPDDASEEKTKDRTPEAETTEKAETTETTEKSPVDTENTSQPQSGEETTGTESSEENAESAGESSAAESLPESSSHESSESGNINQSESEENLESPSQEDASISQDSMETEPIESTEETTAPEASLPAETETPEQNPDSRYAAVKDGKYPLVGIDGCVSAKAYVATLSGLGIHPEEMDQGFTWLQEMEGGVVITLQADEDASQFLNSSVTAEIKEISDSAREAIAANMGILPQDVVAYDINLYDAEGGLIANESWNGYVTVTFSGQRIEQMSAENDALALIHEESEIDGTDTSISPEQIELQVLTSVDVPGTEAVSELSGNTERFSIVGVIPQKPSSTIDVDLAWVDYGWPAGNKGDADRLKDHQYYLEINGLPGFCITPTADYPSPNIKMNNALQDDQSVLAWLESQDSFKTFLDNYVAVGIDDIIGTPVDPAFGLDVVYTEENLLKASIIMQLGYPNDVEGICWRWANASEGTGPVNTWAPSPQTQEMFSETQHAEQFALTGKSYMRGLAKQLYARGEQIYNSYNAPVTLEASVSNIVFAQEKGQGVWATNKFTVNTSEECYSLQLADGIEAEMFTDTGWKSITGENLKAIPKDAVLRLTSTSEPGDGSIDINVSKNKLVLDKDSCYIYKYSPADKNARPYQTLMTVASTETSENTGIQISYSTNPAGTQPEPPTPSVPVPPETTPGVPVPPETTPGVPVPPETTPGVPVPPETTPGVPVLPETTPDNPVPPETAPAPAPNNPGGGSGGGDGGSSSAGRINTDAGGPGAGNEAITLEDLDVPLAALPEAPSDPIEILDEEVPLAALPKTGVSSGAMEISFIISSALMAIYTMLGKKKHTR